MRLQLILPQVVPTDIRPPTVCRYEGCDGRQAVVPLRDGPPQSTARGFAGAQVCQHSEAAACLTARRTSSTMPSVLIGVR